MCRIVYLQLVRRLGAGRGHRIGEVGTEDSLEEGLTLLQEVPGLFVPRE